MSQQAILVIGKTDSDVDAALTIAKRRYPGASWGLMEGGFIGTPEKIVKRIREQAALGWDHAEAAAHVMLKWGFPDDLVCCVRLHHLAEAVAADDRLRESAAAAAALASFLPDPIHQCPDGAERLDRLCRERYGFDPVELATVTDKRLAEHAPASSETPLAERVRRAAALMA